MATEKESKRRPSAPMVQPGQRALLLSHPEYQRVRKEVKSLESYDLLMRQPEEPDGSGESDRAKPASERWVAVRADKYLKHRASGWREAESIAELPERYREQAEMRDAFSPFVDDASEGKE